MVRTISPVFGDRALPGAVEAVRGLADLMPDNRLGRIGVSTLRRLCLAGRQEPFDVTLFGSQRARLHPSDNRCEKRAFAGVHLWDRAERAWLDRLIAAVPRGGSFVFVDAGANVGLYTLSVRAACMACGVTLQGLAIEPDPVNGDRLAVNLAASAAGEVTHAPVALGAGSGEVRFASAGLANRGEARMDAAGGVAVAMRPLLDVVRGAGLTRVDAMKMDIEGAEEAVLGAFFADAPPSMRPGTLVLETGRRPRGALDNLLAAAGYVPVLRTGLNTIFSLAPGGLQEPCNVEA